MSDLERLGRAAAEHQDALADGLADLGAGQRRFLEASAPRPRKNRLALLVAACASVVAALAMALLLARPWRAPSPLTFRVGEAGRPGDVDAWLAAPTAAALPIRFSDGSAVRLAPSARARVTRVESAGATLRVESGRAEVAVAKRKGASWQVSLGPFRVDVTGTRFDVDFSPEDERLVLTMHEGSVVVSGCVFGSGRSFVSGDTVSASCRERTVDIASRAAEPAGASRRGSEVSLGEVDEAGSPLDPSSAPPVAAERARAGADPTAGTGAARAENGAPAPGWRELVRSGGHRAGVEAAEAAGFASQCAQASAEDLVALGDAARYAGRIDRAVEAYSAVRRRFPGHERSAVAAFSLGRVASDQRADHAAAASWFRTYLAERPGGRLARDAQGRLMESLHRGGNGAGARSEALRYLERYPRGPHAEIARALVKE